MKPRPIAIAATPEVTVRRLTGTISMCRTADTDWVTARSPTTSVKPSPATAQCGTVAGITMSAR